MPVTVDDFCGVSVSPVISKVFEHCIFDHYDPFFETCDNQFGFKKNVGCENAIYVLRSTVDYYMSFDTTVNICALVIKSL